jgi:DUF1365 family protein
MALSKALLIADVVHARLLPKRHFLKYRLHYLCVNLQKIEHLAGRFFSINKWNLLSFYDRDHAAGKPLETWIREVLSEWNLQEADGEVVLLALPRVLGFVFNPVSFWFCYNREGDLLAVLAEVSNTFGGRHGYLLHNADGAPLRDGQELRADKAFHVSPFCQIEGSYRFRFYLQRKSFAVRIDYDDADGELLLTSIAGRPAAWSTRALLGAFLRMPLLTAGIVFRIHWQALQLWLKGVPFFGARPRQDHPPLEESPK